MISTGSILLGVALFVLVGLFVIRPLFRLQEDETLTESQTLYEEKEALLDQIQALDFDHDTGKIPTELHTHQRAQLVARATAVLQALDAPNGSDMNGDAMQVDVDSEIEAAIAQLRRPTSPPTNGNGPTRFCSQCGTATEPDDKFCAHCGHSLT